MNTRSFKEYQHIFTTMWKQASTSHLSSWLTDNASGKLLILFILSYLFMLSTSFMRIPKTHNRTSLQVWHANIMHFCSFCKPTFSGATRKWDTVFVQQIMIYARNRWWCTKQLKLKENPESGIVCGFWTKHFRTTLSYRNISHFYDNLAATSCAQLGSRTTQIETT
jgi:hypothetical protein